MAVPNDLAPGTEVASQPLDDNFSVLDGHITSAATKVGVLEAKFDKSIGHKHRGLDTDGPQISHTALIDTTGDVHANYVLADGSRPMTALQVGGLAYIWRTVVEPDHDLGSDGILSVRDHNNNTIMDVVADGGNHYVNLPSGSYRAAGVKLKCITHITFCFDTISWEGQQRKMRLPAPLGTADIVHIGGYVGAVGAGGTLKIGVYKDSPPTVVVGELLEFPVSAPVDAVDDFAVSPVTVAAGDYITVKCTNYYGTDSHNIMVTVTLLADYR